MHTSGPSLAYLTCLISYCFFVVHISPVFPFWVSHISVLSIVEMVDMGSVGPLLCEWLGYTSPNPFWCGGV